MATWANLVNQNVTPTPVVVRATTIIPASGVGPSVPVTIDSTGLQNTLRIPIEVTEILVSVFAREVEAASLIQPCRYGSGVEVELFVDRFAMTDGFIPFPVLTPWNSGDLVFGYAKEDRVTAAETDVEMRTIRRIVLPQPIRLLPGVGFSGRVRRRPPAEMTATTTGSQVVGITLIGRAAPAASRSPTAQKIPFWSAVRMALSATSKVAESTELEFRNPLTAEFNVERIIAAALSGTLAGGGGIANSCTIMRDVNAVGVSSLGANVFDPNIQLRWPNGDLLNTERMLSTLSPFMRNWTYSHPFTLAPNSRVRATVSQDVITYPYEWLMSLFGTRLEVL